MATETDALQQIAHRVNLGAHQFLITATDEEGREGRWAVHRPTMKDELKIAVQFALFKTPENTVNPVEINPTFDNLAYAIATLNVVIDLRPEWFPRDAGDCYDLALIGELFARYCEWKDSFRPRIPGEVEGDSGAPEPA